MDDAIKSPPSTIHFPVSLGRVDHDNSGRGKRKVIDEVDFFSDRREGSGRGRDDEEDVPNRNLDIKLVNVGI